MAKAKLNQKQHQYFGGTDATIANGRLSIGDRSYDLTVEAHDLKIKNRLLKWHKLYTYQVAGEGIDVSFETSMLEPLNNWRTIQYAVRAISRELALTTRTAKASLSSEELSEIAEEKALLRLFLKKK